MSTGLDTLDTSLQKTNEYFVSIEDKLGWRGRRDQTYLAVRTILHRLRDHLPLNENAHLAAQMPIILKGIYFDSWDPRAKPIRESEEGFVNAVQMEFQYDVKDIREVIRIVLQETFDLLSEGEQSKIFGVLSKDVLSLFCPEV